MLREGQDPPLQNRLLINSPKNGNLHCALYFSAKIRYDSNSKGVTPMTNENEQNLPETEDLVRELSALLGENPDAPRSEPAFDIEESHWKQLPWEEAAPPPPKKKTNIKKILYYSLLGVFVSIFLISGIYLISYLVQPKEQGAQYDDLAARVESIRQEQAQNSSNSATGDPNNPIDPEYTGPYADILPEYRDVYAENKDTVGWIRIEGTKINYPVMHTPDRKDYYLKRNFKKIIKLEISQVTS